MLISADHWILPPAPGPFLINILLADVLILLTTPLSQVLWNLLELSCEGRWHLRR